MLKVEELKELQVDDLVYIVMLKDAYRENDTPYGEYHKVVSTLNHYYFIVSDNRDFEYKLAYNDYGKSWIAYKNIVDYKLEKQFNG